MSRLIKRPTSFHTASNSGPKIGEPSSGPARPAWATISLALIGAWAASAAQAAEPAAAPMLRPGIELPPEPGVARPPALPAFEQTTLANGLRVVVAPRHDLPLVTLALHLRQGAAAEPEGRAGLAGITAALRSKGATVNGRALNASQLAAQAEALGGSLGTGADWRGSSVSMTVASSQVDAAAALIAGASLHPTLAEAELQRLKAQSADALKLSLSDPMALAGMAARRAYWGSSVYGASTTLSSLDRLTRQDVLAFQRRQMNPAQATWMVAGDITLAQAVALAQRHGLAAWRAATPVVEPVATQAARSQGVVSQAAASQAAAPQAPATVLVNMPGAGQSGVVVMAPGVADDSPERRVAQVAAAVLGGGYSSRLNTEVRIKRGLSYGAHAGQEFQPSGGVLTAQTQTNNSTAAQVVTLMSEEIVKLGRPGPENLASAEELGARQASLVGKLGRQTETIGGTVAVALDLLARDRPLDDLQRAAPEILAVTPEQVRNFAARHWTAAALRTVVVGDLAAAGESLKPLAEKAKVIQLDQLDLEAPALVR